MSEVVKSPTRVKTCELPGSQPPPTDSLRVRRSFPVTEHVDILRMLPTHLGEEFNRRFVKRHRADVPGFGDVVSQLGNAGVLPSSPANDRYRRVDHELPLPEVYLT